MAIDPTNIKITATDKTKKAFNSIQGRFKTLNKGLSATSGLMGGLGGALSFGSALKTTVEFEDAMLKVQGTLGLTGDAGDRAGRQLTELARKLGSETAFSATQAAQGLNFLALAGYDVEQQTKALPAVLNLASAATLDLGTAADLTTGIMGAFQLEAEEVNRVVDVLAATSQKTKTDVEGIGEAMKFVGPVALKAGLSIEETAAAIGSLANSSITGSQAGTALRAVLLRLASEPKEAADALGKLGIKTKDASGNMRKLAPILKDINEGLSGYGSGEKLELAKSIFGVEAASAGLVISADSANGSMQKLSTQLENAAGTAKTTSEVMESRTGGALRRMNSALESFAISLGVIFLPGLSTAANAVSSLAVEFAKFAEQEPDLVKLGFALAAIGVSLKFMGTPITLAVSGIATLSFLFDKFKIKGENLNETLRDVAIFISHLNGSGKALALILEKTGKKTDTTTESFDDLAEKTKEIVKQSQEAAKELSKSIKETKLINVEEKLRLKQNEQLKKTLKALAPDTRDFTDRIVEHNNKLGVIDTNITNVSTEFKTFLDEVAYTSRIKLQEMTNGWRAFFVDMMETLRGNRANIIIAWETMLDYLKDDVENLRFDIKPKDIFQLDTTAAGKISLLANDLFSVTKSDLNVSDIFAIDPTKKLKLDPSSAFTIDTTKKIRITGNEAFAIQRSTVTGRDLFGLDGALELVITTDKYGNVTVKQKMEDGGYIQGRSHKGGGVDINAEGGEYVIRKAAVSKIGRANLDQLNATGGINGGGVEVNIYDGTGQRISEYDSSLRVEIKERAERSGQFAAVR